MSNMQTNSAKDALEWMENKAGGKGGQVLFRGQSRVWCTIKPSITRDDQETRNRMWAICHRFYSSAAGVTGYAIEKGHDRLAILQHYILRSPVIDLTGTPKVALYFALRGAELGQECVVYAVERNKAEVSGIVFFRPLLPRPSSRRRRPSTSLVETGWILRRPGGLAGFRGGTELRHVEAEWYKLYAFCQTTR